jgi:hypothetical protein
MTKHLQAGRLFFISLALLMTACTASQLSVPVRGYLYRGEPPQQGLGAYGYLVFTKPSASNPARYEKLCAAYQNNLLDANNFGSNYDPSQLMITYWPLSQRPAQANEQDCKQLVANYDYAIATQIASTVDKLAATGPVLVAWRKPYGTSEGQSEALVLDMSDFRDEDFDRAIGIWKDRIVRDPSVWNNGFSYIKAREAFRNFLNQYGETVVAVVKPK